MEAIVCNVEKAIYLELVELVLTFADGNEILVRRQTRTVDIYHTAPDA
jgi:hypothetical protein